MLFLRKFFGILLLTVAVILVGSIVITFSQLAAYFTLFYMCLTQGCEGDSFKDILTGLLTYAFMAFMVYYLGRRGLQILTNSKPNEPETITTILDEADYSHSLETINYFQTKYGYCHVLPDRIIFANTEKLEDVSVYKEGNKIFRTLSLQFIIGCAMLYYIYSHVAEPDFMNMLVPILIVVINFTAIVTSLRNSTTALIHREKIISVSFSKGIPYLIIPSFTIWFYDNKNRKRKRLVILTDNSEKKISEALRIMRSTSLMAGE
jgi:hypothetical protein